MSLRQWMLCKEGQTFIIRWQAGEESRLLTEVMDQVERGSLPLDDGDLCVLLTMIADSIPEAACDELALSGVPDLAETTEKLRS